MDYIKFLLLIILPFVLCLLAFSIFFGFRLKSDGQKELVSILLIIKEAKIERYVQVAFNNKVNIETYQLCRALLAIVVFILFKFLGKSYIYCLTISALIYLSFYLYVKAIYDKKMKEINDVFPYFIKKIIYFCYNNPINNALIKSLDYADILFKENIEQMINDIDKNPLSYQPYQSFINKYDNKIKNLDFYFKSLYSLSNENAKDHINILDSLNKTVSEDMNMVRRHKNDTINDIIGYIGFIPVILLVLALTVILFMSINYV